jgi:hypothetical protein
VNRVVVSNQPKSSDLQNTFGLLANEQVLHQWEAPQYCCSFCGTNYMTLTNNRLLLRTQKSGFLTNLFKCCCKPAHSDSVVYLKDIASLDESGFQYDPLMAAAIFFADFCPNQCPQKIISVRGAFGIYTTFLTEPDKTRVQMEIPLAIDNLSKRH